MEAARNDKPVIPGASLFLDSSGAGGGIPPTVNVPPPGDDARTASTIDGGVVGPPRDVKVIAGRYEVVKSLGEGGMGAVFRVFDRQLKRHAALKMILPEKRDARRETRFVHEARAMAKLQHPGCVSVYDVGTTAEGAPYMVMELVAGEPLNDVIARGEMTPGKAALVMHQIAGALECVHGFALVHRDIKPANIIFGPAGAKLADFGIAHDEEAETRITARGALIGTLGYMPLEQTGRDGDTVDARSDIYAFGATLYECLVGRTPFVGTRGEVLVAMLEQDPVAPRLVAQDIAPDLERICLRCLAREKEGRYQSARDLREDLGLFLEGEPIRERRLSLGEKVVRAVRRNRKAVVTVAATVGVLVAVGVGVWVGGEVKARLAVRALIAAGDKAFAEGEFGKAEATFGEAARVEGPYAAEAREKGVRARAWGFVKESEAPLAGFVAAMKEAEAAEQRVRELGTQTDVVIPFAESKEKAELAALEASGRAARRRARTALGETETALRLGLAAFRDPAIASRFLAAEETFYDHLAEREPDEAEAVAARADGIARDYGCRSPLPEGVLAIGNPPRGGRLHLYRYEYDPKLGVERPFVFSIRESRATVAGAATPQDYYPLLETAENDLGPTPRPIALPSGNYLVLFRNERSEEARFPLEIRRKARVSLNMKVASRGDIGLDSDDFVFIPEGEARMGQSLNDRERCNEFFLQRRKVTQGDWREFWEANGSKDDLLPTTVLRAVAVERLTSVPNRAIRGVSYNQALLYCQWYGRTHLGALSPSWEVGPPTRAEFYRATRGSLRRVFPWGDIFDPTFCGCGLWGKRVPAVMSFPQDCSVFGIYDLAGLVREWVSNLDPNGDAWSVGGSVFDSESTCRAALSSDFTVLSSEKGAEFVGLRLAIRRR
jgi:hypothetical protein